MEAAHRDALETMLETTLALEQMAIEAAEVGRQCGIRVGMGAARADQPPPPFFSRLVIAGRRYVV